MFNYNGIVVCNSSVCFKFLFDFQYNVYITKFKSVYGAYREAFLYKKDYFASTENRILQI